MTSCQKLAERYAKETNNPIPEKPDEDWLLVSTWGCVPLGITEKEVENKFVAITDGDKCAKQAESYNKRPTVDEKDEYPRVPAANYLKEEGFLAWVNERGMQCINKVVGRVYGFDYEKGVSKHPGKNQEPPNSRCWGPCYRTTETSDTCFECVQNALVDMPDLCKPGTDSTLLKEALNCQSCLAAQGSPFDLTYELADAEKEPEKRAAQEAELNDQLLNSMWACITGTVSPGLSPSDIALIVIGSIFVVVALIVLIVWFTVYKHKIRKMLTQEEMVDQRRAQLQLASPSLYSSNGSSSSALAGSITASTDRGPSWGIEPETAPETGTADLL